VPRLDRTKPGGMFGPTFTEPATMAQLREFVKEHRDILGAVRAIQQEALEYLKNYQTIVTVKDDAQPNGYRQQMTRSDQPPSFAIPDDADYRAEVARDVARQCHVFLPILEELSEHASLFREGITLGRLYERFHVLVFDEWVRKHRRLGRGSGRGRSLAAKERYREHYIIIKERRARAAGSKRTETDILRELAAELQTPVSKLYRALRHFEAPRRKRTIRRKKPK
jgi:hypothetical protein